MTLTLEKITTLVNLGLKITSPVLSGNMKSNINIISVKDNEITIEIKAPFYDMKEFLKNNVVKHTGAVIGGKTDYAFWVNNNGGFNTGNSSKHWANRVCYNSALALANELGAEIDNKLPLD